MESLQEPNPARDGDAFDAFRFASPEDRPASLFATAEDRPFARRPRRRRGLLLGWLLLILLVVGLPAVAWVEREQVVRTLPETAALYDLLGVRTDAALAGLVLEDVTLVRRRQDDSSLLIVEGVVINRGSSETELPSIRAQLLAADETVLRSWTIEAERSSLPPGGTTTFQTDAEDVPDDTTINIEFVPQGSD